MNRRSYHVILVYGALYYSSSNLFDGFSFLNSLTFPYNLFPSSHPFLDKPLKREAFVGQKLDMGIAFFGAFGKFLQLFCFILYFELMLNARVDICRDRHSLW